MLVRELPFARRDLCLQLLKEETKRLCCSMREAACLLRNSLFTRLGHRQVKTPLHMPLSGRCSCGDLDENQQSIQRRWFAAQLTEVEVVVLGVANSKEEDDGMDDS